MSLRLMSPFIIIRPTLVSSCTAAAQLRFNSTKTSSSGAKKNLKQQERPSISKIGVPFEPFIPARRSRVPNPLTSPRVWLQVMWKNVLLSAFRVYQRWQFTKGMGKSYTPDYIKFKNDAIDDFVKINTAFANRKVGSVRDLMSDYVFFALGKRQTSLPKTLTLGWDLVKFNSDPKLISIYPFPHDDGSTLLVQLIYRFETKQRLTFKKRGEKGIKEEVKDLTEYLAFNVDPYTEKVILAGSVFESPVNRKLQPKNMPSQEETINNMIINGDIYRLAPSESAKL